MSSKRPGVIPALSLVIASMIGTGVFTSLGFQLEDFDSAPQILFLWLLGGLLSLCGALCYAAIAKALPRSGGEHHFLTEIHHPSLGFMAGILSVISGFAAPTALAALAFGAYLGEAVSLPPRLSATIVILLGTLAHLFSTRTSARIQTAATALKLLLILAFLVAALLLPGKGDIRWHPEPAADAAAVLQPAFAIALFFVFYSYSGWNAAIYGLEEWDQPTRTVRRALILGTSLVTLLYLALNAAFLHAAPVDALRGEIQVGHAAALSLLGENTARTISGLFALGLFASVSALLWAGPRVLAAMGRSTPSLSFFAPKSSAPRAALLAQTIMAILMVAFSNFRDLVAYTQVGLTLSTMLTVVGIFVLPQIRRSPAFTRLLLPATVFLAMTAFVIVRSIIAEPLPTIGGLATAAVCIILWFPISKLQS